jgi:hypothetical protein
MSGTGMNHTLSVACPEPRCRAQVGEHCLRLNRPNFAGERTSRQSHGQRVLAARFPSTPRAVAAHPGFRNPGWTDEHGRTLYEALAALRGHAEALRLWHAAHDVAAA